MKFVTDIAVAALVAGFMFTAGEDLWYVLTGLVGLCRG